MAHFVIIPTTVDDSAALDQAVTQRFGNKSLHLPRGEWLVSFNGTSKQLCDELKISDGEIGVPAAVFNYSGYFGRANKDIWEWIAVNEVS